MIDMAESQLLVKRLQIWDMQTIQH